MMREEAIAQMAIDLRQMAAVMSWAEQKRKAKAAARAAAKWRKTVKRRIKR